MPTPKATARKSIGAEDNFPLCATVCLADDITSNNIVGYMGNDTTAVKSPMFGFTFTPVDGKDYILLGSVKPTGMNPDDGDKIQVINPESLGADTLYTYYSDDVAKATAKAEADESGEEPGSAAWQEVYDEVYEELKAYIGWWDVTEKPYGNVDASEDHITCGSALLGLSPKRHNITFTCNGEAPTTTKAYAPGKVKSPMIANLLPTDFILSDLGVEGMNPDDGDKLQVINPESLGADKLYTYYSDDVAKATAKAEADESGEEPGSAAWQEVYDEVYEELKAYIGWWDVTEKPYGNVSADTDAVKAAAGFLGLSPKRNSMTFKFKSVLDVTKPSAE